MERFIGSLTGCLNRWLEYDVFILIKINSVLFPMTLKSITHLY